MERDDGYLETLEEWLDEMYDAETPQQKKLKEAIEQMLEAEKDELRKIL